MSESRLYQTWGLGNDNRSVLARKLDHFRVFASLLRHCSDWRSKITVLYLIAQRLGVSLKILPVNVLANPLQVYSVRLQKQLISFFVLEDLQPWIEINRERGYEKIPNFHIQPGWTVIDVGGNIGVFSIRAAQHGARVFTFEPNPMAYKLLQMNVSGYGLDQIRTVQAAVGGEAGQGWVDLDYINTTGATVKSGIDSRRKNSTASVNVTTLDLFVLEQKLEKIDFLKIDAEGAEVAILEGASTTLDITDRLVVEYHENLTKGALASIDEILRAAQFYQVYRQDHTPNVVGIVYYQRA